MRVPPAILRRSRQCNQDSETKVRADPRADARPRERAAESDAAATHPAGNRSDQKGVSRHATAATLLPSGLPSTPATPSCLLTKPSVQGKAAVGEELRGALHRSDFMHQFTGKENDLVLSRNNRPVAALRDVAVSLQPRVVNAQLSSLESVWLALKEVNKRQVTSGHTVAAIVAMEVEKISITARGDLGLHVGDGKLFHVELLKDLRQHRLDPFEHYILMSFQIHQNARAAVLVVDDATVRHGRYHFA